MFYRSGSQISTLRSIGCINKMAILDLVRISPERIL
jgi:hypothetical protein